MPNSNVVTVNDIKEAFKNAGAELTFCRVQSDGTYMLKVDGYSVVQLEQLFRRFCYQLSATVNIGKNALMLRGVRWSNASESHEDALAEATATEIAPNTPKEQEVPSSFEGATFENISEALPSDGIVRPEPTKNTRYSKVVPNWREATPEQVDELEAGVDEGYREVAAKVKEAKEKKPRKAAAPKAINKCLCGCGGGTKSSFCQGHDAQTKSKLLKLLSGDVEQMTWRPSKELAAYIADRPIWYERFGELVKTLQEKGL